VVPQDAQLAEQLDCAHVFGRFEPAVMPFTPLVVPKISDESVRP